MSVRSSGPNVSSAVGLAESVEHTTHTHTMKIFGH